MKISSAVFFSGAMLALVTNSLATEIRERNFQFENSTVIFQNDPTFVVGNFEKGKKAVAPKLVLTVKQNGAPKNPSNPEHDFSEKSQQPKAENVETSDAYDAISQCFTNPIYFRFNKTVLTRHEQAKLFEYLNECKEKKTPLVVIGYTCKIGNINQNQNIAEHRAAYIAKVLRQNGFNVVESVGKPKTDFVTDDPKKQHLNRRVVVAKVEHQKEKK